MEDNNLKLHACTELSKTEQSLSFDQSISLEKVNEAVTLNLIQDLIVNGVHKFFNLIQNGSFLNSWKNATIIPIPKPQNDSKSYRPINLLSVLLMLLI